MALIFQIKKKDILAGSQLDSKALCLTETPTLPCVGIRKLFRTLRFLHPLRIPVGIILPTQDHRRTEPHRFRIVLSFVEETSSSIQPPLLRGCPSRTPRFRLINEGFLSRCLFSYALPPFKTSGTFVYRRSPVRRCFKFERARHAIVTWRQAHEKRLKALQQGRT